VFNRQTAKKSDSNKEVSSLSDHRDDYYLEGYKNQESGKVFAQYTVQPNDDLSIISLNNSQTGSQRSNKGSLQSSNRSASQGPNKSAVPSSKEKEKSRIQFMPSGRDEFRKEVSSYIFFFLCFLSYLFEMACSLFDFFVFFNAVV
jgi:hypothetical protein